MILPGEAFGGADAARLVLGVAVGSEGLVAQHGGSIGDVAEALQDAAQRIGQVELGVVAVGRADEVPAQGVVVGAAGGGATAPVDVLLDAEGVDGDAGATRGDAAFQGALTRRVVGVVALVAGSRVRLHQLVLQVVGQHRGDTVITNFCLVALGNVAENNTAKDYESSRIFKKHIRHVKE